MTGFYQDSYSVRGPDALGRPGIGTRRNFIDSELGRVCSRKNKGVSQTNLKCIAGKLIRARWRTVQLWL